jgi:hypothetical protein
MRSTAASARSLNTVPPPERLYVRWKPAAHSAVKGILLPSGVMHGGVSLHFDT